MHRRLITFFQVGGRENAFARNRRPEAQAGSGVIQPRVDGEASAAAEVRPEVQ